MKNTYNRLTILQKVTSKISLCRCSCGTVKEIMTNAVKTGNTKSCGCLRKQRGKQHMKGIRHLGMGNRRVHGLSRTAEYRAWQAMLSRCYNKRSSSFKNYGGRGITVCDPWKECFETFLNDMKLKPSNAFSLDRIDNNGDYSPENCRWANRSTQATNRRTNRIITVDGVSKFLFEWADTVGVSPSAILNRINKGWSIKDAVTIPRQTSHFYRHRKHLIP